MPDGTDVPNMAGRWIAGYTNRGKHPYAKTVAKGVTDVAMGLGMAWKTSEQKAASFAKVNDVLAVAASSACFPRETLIARDPRFIIFTSIWNAADIARFWSAR